MELRLQKMTYFIIYVFILITYRAHIHHVYKFKDNELLNDVIMKIPGKINFIIQIMIKKQM